jgi:hypothetical protein
VDGVKLVIATGALTWTAHVIATRNDSTVPKIDYVKVPVATAVAIGLVKLANATGFPGDALAVVACVTAMVTPSVVVVPKSLPGGKPNGGITIETPAVVLMDALRHYSGNE